MRLSGIKRNLFPALLICASVVLGGNARAFDDVASGAMIDRVGLKVQWFSHTGIGANGRLIDWHLNVNEDSATTYFTISARKYRETFSQNKLSAFGKPLGLDDSVEYAELRKEVLLAEFANEGIKDVNVKIEQYSLPLTTIYTLASNGDVRAIDGDSGETRWTNRIGDPSLPSIGIGSNNNYVAAVNGSTVYCLESSSGKVLWSSKCRDAVGASPAVSDEKVYVPLLNGRLETFDIAQSGVGSSVYVEMGEGTARPIVTEKSVSWPNSRGNFNVAARYNSKSVAYQLRSDDAIVSSPTFFDGIYYVSSLDGFVYAVDEDRGTVTWQVSTGFGITEPPIVLNNYVFVINENRELFKLDAKTGAAAKGWKVPRQNVSKYLGASKENLYVVDPFNQLKVMSQGSGAVISSVLYSRVSQVLANDQTDRIYIASDKGMIQCIREKTRPTPYFHSNELGPVEVEATQKFSDDPVAPQKAAMAEEDPFGTIEPKEDNPFGDDAAKEEANPFGDDSSAKPAEKTDVDDDPFK